MFKKKKYTITSKIKYAFQKASSREKLGHIYVLTDKHSHAVKTFEEVEILRDKAWDLVFELYPRLKGKPVTYVWSTKEIIIKENKNV